MTITTWEYKGNVTSNYNEKKLTILNDFQKGKIELNLYPIKLNQSQFEAVPHVTQVFNILSGNVEAPSVMANVQNVKSSVITEIDRIYNESMATYKESLLTAIELDEKKIRDLTKLPDNWFKRRWVQFYRACTGHHHTVVEQGSAHRYAWMISTGTLEKQRFERTKMLIETRSRILLSSIKEEMNLNLSNQDEIKELKAIKSIFNKIFPKETLLIENENIDDFLTSLIKDLNESKQ